MANEITREAGIKLVGFLKQTAKEKGISDYEIARRTGLIQNNVWRIFNGKYLPSLENFLAICQAIGIRINLEQSEDSESEYSFNESDIPNHYVCTDKANGIVCIFEKGRFNETQKITSLHELTPEQTSQLPTIMRKLGDWLSANHYDKI